MDHSGGVVKECRSAPGAVDADASQAIFIGGKALEKSAFSELDGKLLSLRSHERKYEEATAEINTVSTAEERAKAEKRAIEEHNAFKTEVNDAAEMFWGLYGGEMLTTRPPALLPNTILAMEPETFVRPRPQDE